MKNLLLLIFAAFWFSACNNADGTNTIVDGRWYTHDQIKSGTRVYEENCLICHAAKGVGSKDWMKRDANGKFPPPPLNGTAHTWHHPMSILKRTIIKGGIQLGGSMPGFAEKLTDAEMLAAIAYVQSFWDDKIYNDWKERGGLTR